MNSSPFDLAADVIVVGERTYLYADSVNEKSPQQSLETATIKLGGKDFVCIHAEPDRFADARQISLPDYLKAASLGRVDLDALLIELFGAPGRAPLVERDPTTTGSLFEIIRDAKADDGLAVLHQIAGIETSVLVHARGLALTEARGVYLVGSSTLYPAELGQHGRFLARKHAKLRLTSIGVEPAFKPHQLLVLSDDRVTLLPLNTVVSSSAEELFRRYNPEAPDILGMFYQCCRPLRVALSELFASERRPKAIVDPSWGFQLSIETAFQLSNGYFLSGWYADPEERLVELLLLDQRLADPDVTDHWHLKEEVLEQDGKRLLAKRFRAFVPGQLDSQPILVRLKANLRGGASELLVGPKASYDTSRIRDAILATIEDRTFSLDLFSSTYAPALGPVQEALNERQDIRSRHAFGTRSRRDVSIVIPLFAQLGFMRTQLMVFVNDAYIRAACHIIYVLDDPRLVHEAKTLLEGYSIWADLDIELVVLERNGGFAVANNSAVSVAESELVVLLNSDVIPAHSGWVDAAVAEIRQAPQYSVVGPKLLYADDSLQHAGMFFERFPHGFWQNLHYWKGYGRAYGRATQRRTVPAITGACMILRRADFCAVEGFTPDYISGDYEDSDLCLKLRARGGECIYMPEIELYHFERQSMPKIQDGHDRRSTIYNRALHTHRWNDSITALMAEFS